MPRASTSASAPAADDQRRHRPAAAASAGGRLRSRRSASAACGRTSGRTVRHGRRPPQPRPCRRRSAPAASKASDDMPASGTFQPIARPCAAAIPTRRPVKLPGPTPTRIRVGTCAVEQLVDHRHQPLGMAAADELVARRDDQCPSPLEQRGGAGGGRRIDRKDHRHDPVATGAMWAQAGAGQANSESP